MTKFKEECRTFSKSSKNKWFKLVLGFVFRFPAFPTLSYDLLSILITDPDSALIQTMLMTWAYSSKYGFLVLLFSFLVHPGLPASLEQKTHQKSRLFFFSRKPSSVCHLKVLSCLSLSLPTPFYFDRLPLSTYFVCGPQVSRSDSQTLGVAMSLKLILAP